MGVGGGYNLSFKSRVEGRGLVLGSIENPKSKSVFDNKYTLSLLIPYIPSRTENNPPSSTLDLNERLYAPLSLIDNAQFRFFH